MNDNVEKNNNKNDLFPIDSPLNNPIQSFRMKPERMDVFLIGDSRSAKSAMLAGFLSAGVEKKQLLYNHMVVDGLDSNFRCFYQLLESNTSKQFCTSRTVTDMNVLPCDLRHSDTFVRRRKLNFVETNGHYWRLLSQSMCSDDRRVNEFLQTKYLRNRNRKILLFVIDYSLILEGNDYEQRTMLENVLMTLTHDGEGVDPTKECTMSRVDAVMVLFSKSDLMNTDNPTMREKIAMEHLKVNYLSFMRTLSETCKMYLINVANGFNPYVSTFSVGKICNSITFEFDPTDSLKILSWIEMYGLREGYFDKVFNILKGSKPKSDKKEVVNERVGKLLAENTHLHSQIQTLRKDKRKVNIWVVALTAIAIVVCFFFVSIRDQFVEKSLRSEIEIKDGEIKSLQNDKISTESSHHTEISNLKSELLNINARIDSIKSIEPIVITDLKVGNMSSKGEMETEYGNSIYSSNTLYLSPQIFYKPLSYDKITLYVKLFRPDGELSIGDSSPSGYSTSTEINLSSDGVNGLSGWGSDNKGSWSAGKYRYEIWFNNRILFTKTFQVY